MWKRAAGLVAAALLALASLTGSARAAVAQDTGKDPLARLAMEKGWLSWDGISLAASEVRAERQLGVTLALEHGPDGNPCAKWVAVANRNGIQLTLGFATPRPGAKVEWMKVRFEGFQVMAAATDLARALRAHLSDVTWIAPKSRSEVTKEEDDIEPTFAVPGKEPQVVEFSPREWMVLAKRSCVTP